MGLDTSVARQILCTEDEFPSALRAIPRPVKVLWVAGQLPRAAQPALAIVGARAATMGACRVASALAAAAVDRGFAVISGGALGIDAAAHRGALDAGGTTYAVLGCGVDIIYPDRHAALFGAITATGGGLISEFPLGTPPRGKHFPSRNRIVAGLSRAVVLVEAQARSGALVTARLALAMGRPLLAVPGSPGTDGLLAAGKAREVPDASALTAALSGAPSAARIVPAAFASLLTALADGPAPAPELGRRMGLGLSSVLALISEAELGGWIRRGPGGTFVAALTKDIRGN